MYWRLADWVKHRGQLPHDTQLRKELSSILYSFTEKGQFKLESKELIRKRLKFSPDKADALALTFARPDAKIAQRIENEFDKPAPKNTDIYSWGLDN